MVVRCHGNLYRIRQAQAGVRARPTSQDNRPGLSFPDRAAMQNGETAGNRGVWYCAIATASSAFTRFGRANCRGYGKSLLNIVFIRGAALYSELLTVGWLI